MFYKLHHYLSVIAAVLVIILTGCDEQTVYHTYLPVPILGWEKHDTLVFRTDTIEQEADYQFALEVRSTERYPFQSVWLIVERRFDPTQDFHRDTVECRLLNPTTHRMGEGIYTYQYTFPLPPLHLPGAKPGEIRVRHYMHRETLSGLHDIGIHIMR